MTGKPALAFVVFVATACTPVRVAPGASLDREELAIYTVVIDSVLEMRGDPFVVLWERTSIVGLREEDLARSLSHDTTRFAPAYADLIARNRTPTAVPTRTLSGREIRTFGPAFDVHRDSTGVLRGFEPVRWLHALSRPGIDPERNRAVIYAAANGCGEMCGQLRLILLERNSSGWRVVRADTVMES